MHGKLGTKLTPRPKFTKLNKLEWLAGCRVGGRRAFARRIQKKEKAKPSRGGGASLKRSHTGHDISRYITL